MYPRCTLRTISFHPSSRQEGTPGLASTSHQSNSHSHPHPYMSPLFSCPDLPHPSIGTKASYETVQVARSTRKNSVVSTSSSSPLAIPASSQTTSSTSSITTAMAQSTSRSSSVPSPSRRGVSLTRSSNVRLLSLRKIERVDARREHGAPRWS